MGGKPGKYGSENQGGRSQVRTGDWTSKDGGHLDTSVEGGMNTPSWNEFMRYLGTIGTDLKSLAVKGGQKIGWTKI